MSYLNVPRLHFAGHFLADPSTINNNDNNYDPDAVLTMDPPDQAQENNSVYWNRLGTHNWEIRDCTVRSAVGPRGPISDTKSDPLIGAAVVSAGNYPAKLVDLDPDNQGVSQIWGLKIQIKIADPRDGGKVLASVTATMPPTAFCDLWIRAVNAARGGIPTMSASFQAILQDVAWVNAAASPLLAELQKVSPSTLSIRFNVDSYQPDNNQPNFTLGRLVGTIGPALPGEAPRSTPRRLAPVFSTPSGSSLLSIASTYGPANAVWDEPRGVVILDLGNSIPSKWSPPQAGAPSVPLAGWPIERRSLQLAIGGRAVVPSALPAVQRLKTVFDQSAARDHLTPSGTIDFDTETYLTSAGIVEVPIPPELRDSLRNNPLQLRDLGTPQPALQEDPRGRYVDVDLPFFRMDPNDQATVTLWATLFGQPWKTTLDLAVQGKAQVNNPGPPQSPPSPPPTYATWLGGDPEGIVTLSSKSAPAPGATSINVDTDANGTAVVTLTAGDPGTPRKYSDDHAGPDGQVYSITGSWQSWGQIFLMAGAPLSVLVFSGYPMPAQPTWEEHVYPIFESYARLYPYMKGIIDLGDYETVKENADSILYVLKLPRTNPHHMPIVRDLSRDKLAMIKQWFANGMPRTAGPAPLPRRVD